MLPRPAMQHLPATAPGTSCYWGGDGSGTPAEGGRDGGGGAGGGSGGGERSHSISIVGRCNIVHVVLVEVAVAAEASCVRFTPSTTPCSLPWMASTPTRIGELTQNSGRKQRQRVCMRAQGSCDLKGNKANSDFLLLGLYRAMRKQEQFRLH